MVIKSKYNLLENFAYTKGHSTSLSCLMPQDGGNIVRLLNYLRIFLLLLFCGCYVNFIVRNNI